MRKEGKKEEREKKECKCIFRDENMNCSLHCSLWRGVGWGELENFFGIVLTPETKSTPTPKATTGYPRHRENREFGC